jgi:hypothetical protein
MIGTFPPRSNKRRIIDSHIFHVLPLALKNQLTRGKGTWAFVMADVVHTAITVSSYVVATLLSYRRPAAYLHRIKMPHQISDRVYEWCTSEVSVSAALAKDPAVPPKEAAKKLYGQAKISVTAEKPPRERELASEKELQRAFECGKWGPTRPSELFLRIFHDAICSLEHDPLMGCVSPSLMGSCGSIPLSILAPLPDLVRHMVC